MNEHLKVNIFIFQNLTKQVALWGNTLEGKFTKELKQKFNIANAANKNLQAIFDKELGDLEDDAYAASLVISDCMEIIFKENDIKKRQELFLIMKEYSEGTLKIIEDE